MTYTKLTKAELIARLIQADNRPAATWSDVRALALQTVAAIRREAPLLVKDCYAAGQWLRRQITFVVEEVRRPIIR